MYLMHLSGAPAPSLCNFVPLQVSMAFRPVFRCPMEPSEMSCMCVQMLSVLEQLLSSSALSALDFVLPPGMFGHFESAAHLPTILCVCISIFMCPPMLSDFLHVFGMLAQLLDSTWSCLPGFNRQVAHFRDFLTCTDGFRSVYSRVHAVVNTWNVPVPT